ncbi:hypothetical protein UFOVP46_132 [uncultured Caudovirales phage]|uniref:Uncharacterized protein n=1 Tax=uncultured Caudovirales phage TaxID=2100421 RepID=A0A6J5KS02_9CAUD|nr:hypothetical protein UFOVP46_132 [uncultured Caudovirales phage]
MAKKIETKCDCGVKVIEAQLKDVADVCDVCKKQIQVAAVLAAETKVDWFNK